MNVHCHYICKVPGLTPPTACNNLLLCDCWYRLYNIWKHAGPLQWLYLLCTCHPTHWLLFGFPAAVTIKMIHSTAC